MQTQERSGSFSVKSAYRFFKDKLKCNPRESSHATRQQALWKTFWKLKIPTKVMAFSWRPCREGLPTWYNLKRKQVEIEDKCNFAGREWKTLHMHYFTATLSENPQTNISLLCKELTIF